MMRKKLLFIPVLFIAFAAGNAASAQTTSQTIIEKDEDASCYRKWYRIFKIRGADDVPDGDHENVIIGLNQGTSGNCYYGKAIVKKGTIREIQVRFTDGKFEKIEFDSKEDYLIKNGISDPVVAKLKGERMIVHVIFKEKLRPKGNAYDLAPDPEIDDFN